MDMRIWKHLNCWRKRTWMSWTSETHSTEQCCWLRWSCCRSTTVSGPAARDAHAHVWQCTHVKRNGNSMGKLSHIFQMFIFLCCVYVILVNSDPENGGSSVDPEEKLQPEISAPSRDSPRDSGCYESNENLENGNNSLPHLWLSPAMLLIFSVGWQCLHAPESSKTNWGVWTVLTAISTHWPFISPPSLHFLLLTLFSSAPTANLCLSLGHLLVFAFFVMFIHRHVSHILHQNSKDQYIPSHVPVHLIHCVQGSGGIASILLFHLSCYDHEKRWFCFWLKLCWTKGMTKL